MKPLEKVFLEELGEMLHVEELLLKALPKMRDAASSELLKQGFEDYREDCQAQGQRVKDLFESFELPAREKKCEAMLGVLLKGQQVMQRSGSGATLDAALMCISRKVNCYKAISYETLAQWAKGLGQKEAAKVLEKSGKAETGRKQKFEKLAMICNEEAARQLDEPSRRPAPRPVKKPAEVLNGSRWSEW